MNMRRPLSELEAVYEISQNLVALWKSPLIKGLPRSERNAAIEETRNALIEAINHNATVAQTVEPRTCSLRDAGSIPAGGTIYLALQHSVIHQCAKIAADRATRLRAKAKGMKEPHRQSYFAQSIEAKVIADSILGLLNQPVTSEQV